MNTDWCSIGFQVGIQTHRLESTATGLPSKPAVVGNQSILNFAVSRPATRDRQTAASVAAVVEDSEEVEVVEGGTAHVG